MRTQSLLHQAFIQLEDNSTRPSCPWGPHHTQGRASPHLLGRCRSCPQLHVSGSTTVPSANGQVPALARGPRPDPTARGCCCVSKAKAMVQCPPAQRWGDAGSWGVCRGHLLEELTDHHVGPRRLHRQGEGEQQGNPELRGKPASSKRDPRVVSSKHRGGEGDTVGLLRRSSRSSMASAGAGDCSHRALGCWRHMGTKPLVCDTLRDAPSCEAPSG